MSSHFLLISEESYEASIVCGIYNSFEEARMDAETRTAANTDIQRQSRENRAKSPGLGDPGPYSHDYGVDRATIQEWEGAKHLAEWERDWASPLVWKKTLNRFYAHPHATH